MTINNNRLAGIAYLSVDGLPYMLSGDLSYRVSKVTRETLVGQDTVHGYSEKPEPGFISGTLRDSGSLKLADFNKMTNVTVTVELANGKTITGRKMWTVDAQEVKSMDATFDVRWEGLSVEEV